MSEQGIERGGPDRIYLAPRCCTNPSEGRLWCEDDVWPLDDCENNACGVPYVRADLATPPVPAGEVGELVKRLTKLYAALSSTSKSYDAEAVREAIEALSSPSSPR